MTATIKLYLRGPSCQSVGFFEQKETTCTEKTAGLKTTDLILNDGIFGGYTCYWA